MKRMLHSASMAVACAVGLSTLPASAATLSCTAASGGGQTVVYELGSATDVACFDNANDSGTTLNVFDMTYTLGAKVGDAGGGDGTVFFLDPPDAFESDPGNWAVGTNLGPLEELASLVITLKQGNSFAAFLIEDGVLSGTWRTEGPGQGSTMDLSHAGAWYKTAVIPLPASLSLLVGGIAGLGLVGWRRRPA